MVDGSISDEETDLIGQEAVTAAGKANGGDNLIMY